MLNTVRKTRSVQDPEYDFQKNINLLGKEQCFKKKKVREDRILSRHTNYHGRDCQEETRNVRGGLGLGKKLEKQF